MDKEYLKERRIETVNILLELRRRKEEIETQIRAHEAQLRLIDELLQRGEE